LDDAIDTARSNHPRVREALADVDSAKAEAKEAEDGLAPRISLEGRFRTGRDIDGFQGPTDDYQARVVLRWTPFDSGINHFKFREMQRRESQARGRVNELARQAESDARSAWVRRESQHRLVGELEQQSHVSDDLILSYREQFNVGRRSLLDVLDAQNTRYNVQVQLETARFAELYAQYRLLASTNHLLEALGVSPPPGSKANSRQRFKVKSTPITQVLEPRSAQ
jgi:outer membrane protein, adhesin transport system